MELIRIVSADSEASRVWNDLMDRYHYLGAGPLCGAQLRYLIHSTTYGWLGKLSFSAGAWNVKARDCWIGWSAEVREQDLQQVVCNSRFLIVPQLKVPLLVETFIEQQRFAGTCYRAANFIDVGRTQGRGRQGRSHGGARLPHRRLNRRRTQVKFTCCRPELATNPQPPEDFLAQNPEGFYVQTITIFTMHRLRSGFFGTD